MGLMAYYISQKKKISKLEDITIETMQNGTEKEQMKRKKEKQWEKIEHQ